MSSYPYSLDQIRKTFEQANERGLFDSSFFVNDKDYHYNYKEAKKAYSEARVKYRRAQRDKTKSKDELESLELNFEQGAKEYDEAINDLIYDLSSKIEKRTFTLSYNISKIKDKNIYVSADRYTSITSRIINDEIRKVYKTESPDRNKIIDDLLAYLNEPLPKILIRGDIKHFFESIPFSDLIEDMEDDGHVTPKTIKLLKRLNYSLENGKEHNSGIPRGLSFSSSLSEVYMRSVDKLIRNLDGVFFYRRYVDDIIILADPQYYSSPMDLFRKVCKAVNKKKLALHTPQDKDSKFKAEEIKYDVENHVVCFDYLGYHIEVKGKEPVITVSFTDKKFVEYKSNINKILRFYTLHAFTKPKASDDKDTEKRDLRHKQPVFKLYKALNYLTRNFRLGGQRQNVLTGIYFNHRRLNDLRQLKELDSYLYDKADKYLATANLKNPSDAKEKTYTGVCKKIKEHYSFYYGFIERRMCHMPSPYIKMVKKMLR